MNRFSIIATIVLTALAIGPVGAAGNCPSADAIVATVEALDLAQASRTARFDSSFPVELYRKAANKPGTPVASREATRPTACWSPRCRWSGCGWR